MGTKAKELQLRLAGEFLSPASHGNNVLSLGAGVAAPRERCREGTLQGLTRSFSKPWLPLLSCLTASSLTAPRVTVSSYPAVALVGGTAHVDPLPTGEANKCFFWGAVQLRSKLAASGSTDG